MTNQPTRHQSHCPGWEKAFHTEPPNFLEPHDHVCLDCHEIQRTDCHEHDCAPASDVQAHGGDVSVRCDRCAARAVQDGPYYAYANWLATQAEFAHTEEPSS